LKLDACNHCEAHLPLGPRPIYQLGPEAKILIASQAPGLAAHNSGIAFDDPSGVRLRAWMGLDESEFYDANNIAILPMGLCYPGKGKSGDLPPRPECARIWRKPLMSQLSKVKLTLIIGRHALKWHLPEHKHTPLHSVVQGQDFQNARNIVLPHPSPRNNIWLAKNRWFEAETVPMIQQRINALLRD
jgi:uracil-DNA glycosylase